MQEKPQLFQFVPNEKQVPYGQTTMVFTNLYLLWYIHNSVFIWFLLSQVKAAHQLLKTIPHSNGRRRVDGVPVFSAQNLDIAIATKDGIKWCELILLYDKKKSGS